MRAGIAAVAIALTGKLVPSHAEVGGSLGLTSDYVYRGISQTRGEPALQTGIHYMTRGWTAGAWASTVELNNTEGRTVELNGFLAHRWTFPPDWAATVSAVHYAYPWNSGRVRYRYNELVSSLGFRNTFFLTVGWSLDTSRFSRRGYVTGKNAFSYEAAMALPLKNAWTANLGVGYYDMHDLIGTGYLYWNAGVSVDWRAWRGELSYIGTSNVAEELFYGNVAGDRVVAGISWRF